MHRHIFSIYHPAVLAVYFVGAIVCAMLTYHPFIVLLSFLCASVYAVYLTGIKKYISALKFAAAAAGIIAILNPLFNSSGATEMFVIAGKVFTAEAFIYGLSMGGMLASVIMWFICYHEVFTSEKFMFVFGRFLPSISLMLSMITRFVPSMIRRSRDIRDAQAALLGESKTTKKEQLASGVRLISILMSWDMENSIETADSMRCRGYNGGKRSSFNSYRFRYFDVFAVIVLGVLLCVVIILLLTISASLCFYPVITNLYLDYWVYVCYAVFLLFPLLLEGGERIRCLRSK